MRHLAPGLGGALAAYSPPPSPRTVAEILDRVFSGDQIIPMEAEPAIDWSIRKRRYINHHLRVAGVRAFAEVTLRGQIVKIRFFDEDDREMGTEEIDTMLARVTMIDWKPCREGGVGAELECGCSSQRC